MTEPILPPPAFRHSFVPGEIVTDADFARFDRYLPRQPDETGEAYVARLQAVGLAVAFSADEARDFQAFKRAQAEAAERRIPLAMNTAESESTPLDAEAHEAEKGAALAAVRAAR